MIVVGDPLLQGTEALSANLTSSLGLFAASWRLGSGIRWSDCTDIFSPWTISPLLFIHVDIPDLFRDLLRRIMSENTLGKEEVQVSGLVLFRVLGGFMLLLGCFFFLAGVSPFLSPLSSRRTRRT